jgi:hypothetical protein
MQKMKMCPMMMGQQMPMMQMPMMMQPPCMQMPMMQPLNMKDMEEDEDEKDEEHFAAMQGDTCKLMMIYVVKVIEKTELTINIYDVMPDPSMVDRMTGEAFEQMMREHPEIVDNKCAERSPYGSNNIARDLLGILLIGELIRRRRRRRRPYGGYPGYGGFPY